MWNNSIKLPKSKSTEVDEDGFETEEYVYLEKIPANFTDVTRNDVLVAMQAGYTANQNIEIMKCNYGGQSFLVDESTGDVYDIRRTFAKDKSMLINLTCERRSANGDLENYRI